MGRVLALLLIAGCSGGTCDLSTGIIGACDYRMGMNCFANNQAACIDWHDEQDSFNHVSCTCGTQDLYKAGVACDSSGAIGYCLYESFGKSCQVGWYFLPAGADKATAQSADNDNCTNMLKGKFTAM